MIIFDITKVCMVMKSMCSLSIVGQLQSGSELNAMIYNIID